MNLSLSVGGTRALTVTARDAAAGIVNGRPVTYASSNEAIGLVSASGVVTARAVGTATITATVDGVADTVALTVTATPVSIAITPPTTTLGYGNTLQLAAAILDGAGAPIVGATATWASSNPAAATVDGTGLVTGVEYGTATMTASSGSISATRTITVGVPAPEAFEWDFAADGMVPRAAPAGVNDARYKSSISPQAGNGFVYGKRLSKPYQWELQHDTTYQIGERGLTVYGVAPDATPVVVGQVPGPFGANLPGFNATVAAFDPATMGFGGYNNGVFFLRTFQNNTLLQEPFAKRVGFWVAVKAHDAANVGKNLGELRLELSDVPVSGGSVKNIVLTSSWQFVRVELAAPAYVANGSSTYKMWWITHYGAERATSVDVWNLCPLVNTELHPTATEDLPARDNTYTVAPGATVAQSASRMAHESYGVYVGGFAKFMLQYSDNWNAGAPWLTSNGNQDSQAAGLHSPDYAYTQQDWRGWRFFGSGWVGQDAAFDFASGNTPAAAETFNIRMAVALLPYPNTVSFPTPSLQFRLQGMNNASTYNQVVAIGTPGAGVSPDAFGLYRASFSIPSSEPATLWRCKIEETTGGAGSFYIRYYRFQAWRDPYVSQRNKGTTEQLIPSGTLGAPVDLGQARLGIGPNNLFMDRAAGFALVRFRLPWAPSTLPTQAVTGDRVQRVLFETGPAASSDYTLRAEFHGAVTSGNAQQFHAEMFHTGSQATFIDTPLSGLPVFAADTDYVLVVRWLAKNFLDYAFLGGAHGTTAGNVVWRTANITPIDPAAADWNFQANSLWVGQDRDNDSCLDGWIRDIRVETRTFTQAQVARIMADVLART